MEKNIIEKLKNKSISDLFKSVCCRFEYTFINPIKPYVIRFLYFIFRLLPIDKNLIIFESEQDYCDNSWALYQYIRLHYPQYHFVWATLKKKKYNNDPNTKFVYHPYRLTFLSAWYISRAHYIFYTHGLGAGIEKRNGQLIFNLWHGVGIKGTKNSGKQIKPYYDYIVCTGTIPQKIMQLVFGCNKNQAVILGYPRFDLLVENIGNGYDNVFVPKDFKGKVIIWMPTFRKSKNKFLSEDCETATGLPLMETVNDIINLNHFLQKSDVVILVKIHHLQANEPVFKLKFSNILFITDDMIASHGLQLYQMLGQTDALLSDYSSISTDYLMLDRPMGFILDDIKEFEAHRGANLLSVSEGLAGSYIYNIEDLRKFISDIAAGIDATKPLRDKLLPKMIAYPDNQNCKRICDFCGL